MSNIVSFMLHDYPESLVDKIRSKAPASGSQDDVISRLEDLVWSDAARTRRELQARLNAAIGDRLTFDLRLWLEHLGKGGERENRTSA